MIDGKDASLVVLSHPDNFRSPQKARLHPVMPYFSYSPVVDGAFSIEKGRPYRSRYRYLVGTRAFEREWLEAQWLEFAALAK